MSERLVVGIVLLACSIVFVVSVVSTIVARLSTRSEHAAKKTNARINRIR